MKQSELSREERLRQLQNRQKEAAMRKDAGGFSNIYKDGDVKTWKCAEGKHKLDIVSYISGGRTPGGRLGELIPAGEVAYVFDYWVHFNVGTNDSSYLCLSKTFGEPCPICEDRKRLQQEDVVEETIVDGLKAKRRTLYNVVVYDTLEEERKGVQVWDVAYFFMERTLKTLEDSSGEAVIFADADEGKQIRFVKKGSGAGNTAFLAHQFIDRDYDIHPRILDSAYCLDQIVHIPTYEEVRSAYLGKKQSADSDVPVAVQSAHRKVTSPADDVPWDVTEGPTRLGRTRGLGDTAGEVESARKPKPEMTHTIECPAGGAFGEDYDQLEECDDCPEMDACGEESGKLKLKLVSTPKIPRRRVPKEDAEEVAVEATEESVRIPKKTGKAKRR